MLSICLAGGMEGHVTSWQGWGALERWAADLAVLERQGHKIVCSHGHWAQWSRALEALPPIEPCDWGVEEGAVAIGSPGEVSGDMLRESLEALIPWRKGPFRFFDLAIDSEWRSNWKWDRLAPHLPELAQKTVLDVGGGNGYYLWRLRERGAARVLGVDPTALYAVQFRAQQHFICDEAVQFLVAREMDLPEKMEAFDVVLSLGVLSHQRSPWDHLAKLYELLRPGGELFLETLTIEGGVGELLSPHPRYAKMRNVWLLPSEVTAQQWLERCRFAEVELLDISLTTVDEQRATPWMRFESLADFLDPSDATRTIEGYPAPRRALFRARKSP